MLLPIVAAFFALTLVSVSLAGYFFVIRRADGALMAQTLTRVGEALPARPSRTEGYRKQLVEAGYRQPSAPQAFFGVKICTGFVLACLCATVSMFEGTSFFSVVAAIVGAGGLGYLLPDRLLAYLVRRRSGKLLAGLTSAIDLMILCLEAGQSLDSALLETAREMGPSFPELSAEFQLVRMELLASRGRPEVFRSLRDRNAEPELKRVAQVLIDSDRFGTGLAPSLRGHVRFLRIRLRQQAYEQARKLSVKLVFPVFFLIFPAVILVTLGPALIQVYSQLGTMLGK